MAIPNLLHQLWLSPDAQEIPDDITKNVTAWKFFHPQLNHCLWRGEVYDVIQDVDGVEVAAAMRACRLLAMRADLARLALVYNFGGFWSDLKNRPLRPFLEGLREHALLLTEHAPKPLERDADLPFCNVFFGAIPRHPVVFDMLREAVQTVERREQDRGVHGLTGHGVIKSVLRRWQAEGKSVQFGRLSYGETWGKLMKRTRASYNKHGHWSKDQGPLYNESV
jgi:mannosyltransferase OCH1-like enzyme